MENDPIIFISRTDLSNLSSASGIEYMNGYFYVTGDDSPYLLKADSDFLNPVFYEIFPTQNFVHRIPRNIKHDSESIAMVTLPNEEPFLLILGSASWPQSRRAIKINPVELPKHQIFDTTIFWDRVKLQTEIINIEASAQCGKYILMGNRANNSHRTNSLIIAPIDFYLPKNQVSVEFSMIDIVLPQPGVGISDVQYIKDADILLFTATTEDTQNALDDGAIGDSYIGWIREFSKYILHPIPKEITVLENHFHNLTKASPNFSGHKIEGIAIEHQLDYGIYTIVLVSDNDDGSSMFFKAIVNVK